LLIKADVATKHGLILKIMQIAKGVGIETINMAIDNKAEVNKK
jgi:biopolymer transport protein ExbD